MSVIAGARGPRTTDYNPGDVAKSITGWTATGDAGYTFADLDGQGGGIVVTCDGDNNDGLVVKYGGESVFPGTAGNRFGLEATIVLTEADVDNSNWFVGFSDESDGADFFDDSGVLKTMDAIGFRKLEGSLFFRTVVQNATANSGETTTKAFVSATTYDLRIEGAVYKDGITAKFYVNEELIDTVTGVSVTDFGAMHPVVAVATSGTAEETITVTRFRPYANAA